jgi:hypothetical protein
MPLGDTLKKFSKDPKGLFESIKFEFLSTVVEEILSVRSNPKDSKDRSWLSLHEEFYRRDIESWRNENSFILDIFVCCAHEPSSASHVLAERWRFNSGYREPADGEEWNARAEHAKLQEVHAGLKAALRDLPAHRWLQSRSNRLQYGCSPVRELMFDFKTSEASFALRTAFGVCLLEVAYRQDLMSLPKGDFVVVIQPSMSCASASCHVISPRRGKSSALSISMWNMSLSSSLSPTGDSAMRPMSLNGFAFLGSSPPVCGSFSRASLSLSLSPSSDVLTPFAGSFEESLLSGRMSNTPFTVFQGFTSEVAIAKADDHLKMPPKLQIPFDAIFYHVDPSTPYVAKLELPERGYRIPARGILRLTLSNPSATPLKTFLVQYDLTDMPPEHKTFLRQRIVRPASGTVVYAVHLRFSCPAPKHYFLAKHIKVVFSHRIPDDVDNLHVTYDSPKSPRYFPY